ncbi:MAG: DeoR family transcriptional regulator [Thermoproteota archaeon]
MIVKEGGKRTMKNSKDRVLHTFYTESQLKILELLWDKGPLSVEDIINELHMSPEQVRRELEVLEKNAYVVGRRVETHSNPEESYYATIGKERLIELGEIALKYSSIPPALIEMEEKERRNKEIRKFACKAHLD